MAEIYTYGGGEVLFKVFKGIAMLMNGQNGEIFRPMMLMGASIGAIWAIGKAFWESRLEGLISQWFMPMVVILGIFMIPSETVHIIDPLTPNNRYNPVDHVPLGLARPAQIISSIGYALTRRIEHILAVPTQLQYNQTGMIFGGDTFMEMSQYAITDEKLASSMRHFVENCIVYDLCLKLYTEEEMKNSKNIWDLIKGHTSRVRLFKFCEKESKRCDLVSCRDGAGKLETLLKKHREQLSKHHIFQFLPHFYQYLTRVSQDAQNLISQQVMIHTIANGIDRKCDALSLGTDLAVKRAYLQQRHTYEVVGALAAKALVVLRNVFEALIYASFMFVMPFSLMPLGFRIFLKWLSLLLWIQLWPPFYAILNGGILGMAHAKAQGMLGIESGFTLMTANNLHNLAMDMHVYASYLSLSVPFLSYGLLQGGISSFVHLSSVITGVSQGAGSVAAQEQTTGNYSYGNLQLANASAFNETLLQNQLTPSLQLGFYQENRGTHSTIFGQDGRMIMHDPQSFLPFEINMTKSLSAALNRAADESMEAAQRHGEAATESILETNRHLEDWITNKSRSSVFTESISYGTDEKVMTSFQNAVDVADSLGKRYSVSDTKSFEVAASVQVGVSLPKVGGFNASISAKKENSSTDAYESALNTCERENFSKTYESFIHAAQQEQVSTTDEEAVRLSQQISDSYDKSKHHQQLQEKYVQEAASLRETANWTEQNSFTINRKETDKFVEFVAQEKLDNGEIRGNKRAALLIRDNPVATEKLLDQFIKQRQENVVAHFKRPDLVTAEGFKKSKAAFKNSSVHVEHSIKSLQEKLLAKWEKENGMDINTHRRRLEAKYQEKSGQNASIHKEKKEYLEQGKCAMEEMIMQKKQ